MKMEFPKYINVYDFFYKDYMSYILYKTITDGYGHQKAEYRAPSAFSAYCKCIYFIKENDKKYVRIYNDKQIVQESLLSTNALHFLRTNATYIDFPSNKELICIAMNDLKNSNSIFDKLIYPIITIIDDDNIINGLPSKKILPFTTINWKLVDIENFFKKILMNI